MSGAIGQSIGGFLGSAHGTAEALSELNEGRRLALAHIEGFSPTNFSSPGYGGSYNNRTFSLTRSDALTDRLRSFNLAYDRGIGEIRGLADQVTPGFGALTSTRVAANEANRRRAIGNLRENLQRRRVLGSSFGQDALTRANLEYSQEEDRIRAESFLQELEARQQLLTQANQMEFDRNASLITQFNFESQMAAQFTSQLNTIFAGNTQLAAQITADMYTNRAQIWENWQVAHLQMLQSGTSSLAGNSFGGGGGGGSSVFGGGLGGSTMSRGPAGMYTTGTSYDSGYLN